MKTHYSVLFFTFVINFFMFLSLNSFSNTYMYMPVLFLYFLSNMAAFIDKYVSYKDVNYKAEQYISLLCFVLSAGMIALYLADSLHFLEITFKCDNGKYHMLVQGMSNSFFTFNSINITYVVFIIAVIMPVAYLLLCYASYLRDRDYTKDLLLQIVKKRKKTLCVLVGLSILSGLCGILLCYLKYNNSCEGYGTPQWIKYFFAFATVTFCVLIYFFIPRAKKSLN